MQTPQEAGVWTSYLASNCNKCVSTAQCLVYPFCLTVSFQMITRSGVEVDIKGFIQRPEKWEMNLEPLLEMMWEGTLCFKKTWRRKSLANSREVIVSSVGIKMHCLER